MLYYMPLLNYNNSFNDIKGIVMKNCIKCGIEYKPKASEKSCSIKCKLLSKFKANDAGCWIWQGSRSGLYGKVRFNSKTLSVHKASYKEFVGDIPFGKWVCHKCDTPACFNPDHLFIGSPSDNRRDAVSKKRIKMGIDNVFSHFTYTQILEMRSLKSEGFTYDRIARIFNCSVTHAYNIIKNKYRKEL